MQIGIDLGATKIEYVLLDNNNVELKRDRIHTPKDYENTIISITEIVKKLENKSEKFNVGICHPGAVDKTTGLIKNAHNSQWLNNKNLIKDLKLKETEDKEAKIIKIPICLDEEFSLDLNRLSKNLNIEKDQIIQSFLNKEYFCYMTGFIAGMPFLGDIDSNIRLNRLETPRVKVPKGSVGITEQFCNIYTFESPGGWNIIGNTPIKVFDKSNEKNPVIINPGDRVIFYEINKDQYLEFNE